MWCIKITWTKKAVSLLTVFLCLAVVCAGQETFSKRYPYGYSALFKMVMLTDYGYLVMGEGRDTVGEYFAPLLAVSYDVQGEVISTKTYGSQDLQFLYDTVTDTDARLNDSTFVILTQYYEAENDTNYVAAMWLNEVGDTLATRKYISPYYIEGELYTDYNALTSITVSDDGQFIYFVSQIFHSSSQNNFMIKKLTAQGNEVWTYVNELGNGTTCNAIVFFDNQIWFTRNNDNSRIISLNADSGGIETNQLIYPNALEFIYTKDFVIENDNLIISTIDISEPGNLLPIIYKCDLQGNEIFQISPPEAEYDWSQYNEHIVQSPDGGYVSCSVKYEEIPNPNDPDEESSNNTSEKIWLWKVDSDGVFQWQRFYEYLTFDSGYFYLTNTANDMKSTPDGGYIMAGQATANCLEWPCLADGDFTQQGWLLKVDGCGCLVPGCDDECIAGLSENGIEMPNYFRFGPNPVRDNLNVYIPKSPTFDSADLTLVLSNAQGQHLRTLPLKHDDTTYIIDASNLSVGVYWLSLNDGNAVLQTERLVVER